MIELKIKLDRRFLGQPPAKVEAAKALAEFAAKLLRGRVNEEGKDADGRPLPVPKSRWLIVPTWSPLVAKLPTEGRSFWAQKGTRGKASFYRWKVSYAALKERVSGKPWRGASWSGEMWKKLTAVIKPGTSSHGIEIRLRFAGSVVVPGPNGKRLRFQNRDKAYFTQFAHRSGNTGAAGRIDARAQDASNTAGTGKRDFALMRFSQRELGQLTRFWLDKVQMFGPA